MVSKQICPVYVINLDRSSERWQALQQNAALHGVAVERVSAVEGKLLAAEDLQNCDQAGFRRDHGKNVMPAEIGCYFSHLNVLQKIAEGEAPLALIVEDDICFTDQLPGFLQAVENVQGWDMIKLVNHRVKMFRRHLQLGDDIALGRCLHGPSGSSAAYVVTREGAKKLLFALQKMHLPYDVALERGWAGDYRAFTTDKALVGFAAQTPSTIVSGGRSSYAKAKLPMWKRSTTLFFRIKDYVERIIYGLKPSGLKLH